MVEEADRYVAVVLAADRTDSDPVSAVAGTACKAFVSLNNVPMIIRVLDALEASGRVERILVCGPAEALLPHCPELIQRLRDKRVTWLANRGSPAGSVEYCLQQLDDGRPVFLTTADNALLTPEIVCYFLDESEKTGADATLALVEFETIRRTYTNARRTVTRLRDGDYCGCNLYVLFNHRARGLISWWRQVEQQRKHPRRWIARLLGPLTITAYLLGLLTLERGMRVISNRIGSRLRPVILPFARAGIDVDKAEDLYLVESILVAEETAGGTGPRSPDRGVEEGDG